MYIYIHCFTKILGFFHMNFPRMAYKGTASFTAYFNTFATGAST